MKYELLPPTDPRVLSSIAPFDINTFKKQEKIELKEFVENMFETTINYKSICSELANHIVCLLWVVIKIFTKVKSGCV